METVKIQKITVDPDSIRAAIASLDEAIEMHTKMKGHFEEILALQGGREVKRPRGRPRKSPAAAPAGRARRGRPAGGKKTLREAVLETLRRAAGPVKPVEIRNRLLASGYPTKMSPESLYTAIFTAVRNEPSVVKTSKGFKLTAGGAAARTGKKRAKKRAPSRRRVLARKVRRKKTTKKVPETATTT